MRNGRGLSVRFPRWRPGSYCPQRSRFPPCIRRLPRLQPLTSHRHRRLRHQPQVRLRKITARSVTSSPTRPWGPRRERRCSASALSRPTRRRQGSTGRRRLRPASARTSMRPIRRKMSPPRACRFTACKVNGSGSTAMLACGQPIVAAISSACQTFDGFTFCSFLDKEFLAIDPGRSRLYMSYTEFGPADNGVVELAVCDLSSPASPTCHNGSDGSITGAGTTAAPYFIVAPGDPNFCENEGAYPAVDRATGDVYVAFEHDWFSGLFNCGGETTQNIMNRVPISCLTLTPTSPCAGPSEVQPINITSLEAAFIPGYNRFPMNDFPRVAVSSRSGTISMVWNDTRQHGTGDIFLQSFNLGSLTPVQSQPVRVNSRSDTGGWLFLPAVRNADASGNLDISFYSRSSPNTALTDLTASLKVDPRTTGTPTRSDTRITTGSSDWNADSSVIVPNFGDYTDNYFVGSALYVAWSDGRLGFPQPLTDSVSVH